MPADGGRTCVQAAGDKFNPQFDDPFAHRDRSPLRARTWSPGAWLDGFEAALSISPEEPVQVAAADAAGSCGGRDGQLR
jgi:hypothetical protein